MRKLALVGAVLMLVAMTGAAQDWTMEASFGSVELTSGFTPDPYVVEIVAGGSYDAGAFCSDCAGSVAEAPDFDLYYEAGNWPLFIYVSSGADTTLLIRAPDGEYYGNDDAIGYDPMVAFEDAMSGLYSIWVGTFGDAADAAIYISETEPGY